MKTKLTIALCVLVVSSASVTPCFAGSEKSVKIIADVTVLRPGGLFATALGSVFFVVSLPFSAASGTIKETAHTLVVEPAKATFLRPLGDLTPLQDVMSSDD